MTVHQVVESTDDCVLPKNETPSISSKDVIPLEKATDLLPHDGDIKSSSRPNTTEAMNVPEDEASSNGHSSVARQSSDLEKLEGDGLPRVDGGLHCWLFLAGCFMVEALVWGFPFSYGVFQDYYTIRPPFSTESGIPAIGTCATGIMYFEAPFINLICKRWPKFRRWSAPLGLVIIVLALVASSYAKHVSHLILTQGILYAIGGGLMYVPNNIFIDEWFVKRKGFAFGVNMAGSGVSGVIIPFVMAWGLHRYSQRTMLLAWALTLIVLAGPLLYFVKPRLPHTDTRRTFDFSFLRSRTFWILQTGNILESLGYFIPTIYLPEFARIVLGVSQAEQTMTVSLLSTTSVLGAVAAGMLVDHFDVTTVILISTLGSSISVFLLWGFASSASLVGLCLFGMFYGFFAGGYSITWAGVIHVLRGEPNSGAVDMGFMIGLFCTGRGIGSVASGPVSEGLMYASMGSIGAYATPFGGMIIFTGFSALLGGLAWVAKEAGWFGKEVSVVGTEEGE